MNLPLIDNCFLIDATLFEKYTTCRRSFQYFGFRKRQATGKRSALEAGGIFHTVMEVRRRLEHKTSVDSYQKLQEEMCHLCYTGWDNALSGRFSEEFVAYLHSRFPIDKYHVEDMREAFPGFSPDVTDFRTESHMIDAIRAYNKQYLVEPFDPVLGVGGEPLVEMPFAERLCTIDDITVYWTGRLDYPTIWPGEELWNVDLKTASRDEGFEEYYVNQAQVGYLWALWKKTGMLPRGFMIDKVLWRPETKTGKGIEFKRHKEIVEKPRIEEWEHNTIAVCEDIIRDAKRGYFPIETSWCKAKWGCCEYLDVCKLPPANRDVLLQSSFFKDVTWSPLRQPKAKLTNNKE
jgi:hypothetical protein